MPVSSSTQEKSYRIEDYRALPEGTSYQLVEGKLIMTPAPSPRHQIVSANLFKKLSDFVDKREAGIVLYSPLDVYLGDENAYQPDIVFIAKDRANIIKQDGIYGEPDLVIEILSPSTAYYDMRQKFRVYERFGVREYWLVDPEIDLIEIYSNVDGHFSLASNCELQGNIASSLLKGFEVRVENVFPQV